MTLSRSKVVAMICGVYCPLLDEPAPVRIAGAYWLGPLLAIVIQKLKVR
jgi:hypothetical protein